MYQPIALTIATSNSTVTVQAGGDLIETDPTFHTDVDRMLIDELPVESASSSLSSIITLSTPGVSADSNGLFHGLGDHAENAFYLDGQPITDQQSKVFQPGLVGTPCSRWRSSPARPRPSLARRRRSSPSSPRAPARA